MVQKTVIVEQIKEYLLNNGYKPGDRIPKQSELSDTLNISVRSLRDSITILVNQGFLITKGRGGTFMASPRTESVVQPIRLLYEIKDVSPDELIQARAMLEQAIIKEACSNRTTKDMLKIQSIIDQEQVPNLPVEKELELDKNFHLQIIKSAHNRALDIVGNIILLQLDLLVEKGLYPENDIIRPEDHQKIMDAIFAKDGDLAADLVYNHIQRCRSVGTVPGNCEERIEYKKKELS